MAGFYDKLLSKTPIEREVEYMGEKLTVYFRKINAGERLQLTSSQKMLVGGDNKPVMEFSLFDTVMKNHKLIQMSNVDDKGVKIFKSVDEVQKLPDQLVAALVKIAEEVNRETEETGKE